MRKIGIVLIGAGVLALIYAGFTFTTKEKVADIGPIEIKAEKKHSVDWPPITGAVLIVGGIILMVMDKKK